jgi:tRNA G18 (ribose-2'-O)-methylase SpoU
MGFQCAALALRKDAVSIRDGRLKEEEKLAVLLGAEGDGLSEETIDRCAYTIKIPMAHGVDSLNVAACSAVAFWELSGKE